MPAENSPTPDQENEQRLRDYLKRATSELRSTRRALDEERAAREAPLAIVSMACRFPGGIATPEALWEALTAGRDLVGPFPTDRGWDLDRLFDDDPEHLGTSYAREGAFLDGATAFDAGFFEVSPREALAMDPQQRLLLETSWEAFERAGLDPHALRGRPVGVYVGASNQGYGAVAPAAQADVEGHVLTGTSGAVVSGRLAYTFGLEGPAVTVDTMCSSSLVALHLAAQAIRAGECEAALVGGATVMAGPRNFVEFSRQRGLAPDGRCKPFAAGADGTGWGEAVGVLVVEPLAAAQAAGHPVLAVLRGTAINSDGASNGLTAPNGPAQQRVIRDALRRSGLEPHEVDVVEAHGTGTELGDPIEAQALLATYGQDRERPLLLGALKGATGHTQAASGVAGVIKTVLALQHGLLPATLHVDAPSPHVDWTAGSVELLTESRPWEADGRPRRAGISSFGGSGTNSHAVVEEAPADSAPEASPVVEAPPAGPLPWVLSARDADALSATAAALLDVDAPTPAVAAALAARSTFEHRALVVDGDADGLRSVAEGGVPERGARGRTVAQSYVPVFVFPGQGAQWVGMGAELLAAGGTFADRLRECSEAVVAAGGPDVLAVLSEGAELDDVAVVQPASWAVMVALAAAWEAAGVEPGAVVGHSQGEIAAAVVAGALSVADGARVVTARAQALRAVAGSGAMGSLGETEDAARARVAGLGAAAEGVEVAAVNGPSSVVVAGPVAGVEAVLAAAEADGRRARRIAVDYASHTPGMEPLRAPVTDGLAGLTPAAPRVPWFSTHDADWIDDDRAGADYWFANLRDTVRFADAIAALAADGFDAFVEVSAHPVLAHAVVEVADDAGVEVSATGTLRRDDGGPERLLVALGEAWVGGLDVDWTRLAGGADPRAVALPTYPFTRRRFWLDPVGAAEAGAARDPLDEEFWAAVEARDAVALAGDDPDGTIARALPVLADWRRRRTAAATQDSWRYRITWAEHPCAGAAGSAGPWVLARSAGTPADDPLVTRVRDALGDVTELVVDPADDRTALAGRLADLGDATAVVSLLAADVADHPTLTGLPRGLVATLHLLQAMTDAEGPEGSARLWALTIGAESTSPDDRPSRPLEAAVWGLGRVAALEHPDRWGGLVDLAPDADLAALPTVLTDPEEDQVALRGDRVLVRRLERAPRAATGAGFASRGTALVTGGTGGLGAHTARLLARTGTEHLVLTSRRGPDAPGAEELRAELAELGARVTIAAVDATDPAAVRALVEGIEADGETVRTVAHTAGVGILVAIADTTDEQFVDGAVGKLAGARVLDALFDGERGAALDTFVLFSSVAGLWGSGDHGAYSASNAVVDAMAGERRARGLAGTSIPWGIWEASGGGMGQDVVSTQLKWRGIRFMAPDLAIGAMADLLVDDESLLAVADIDWDVFAPVFTASRRRPLLDGVPDVAAALAGETASAEGSDDEPGGALRARLATAADPQRVLRDAVREAVGRALSFDDAAAVDPDRAFRELGVDSLTAVALRNGVQAETGVRLPVTVVFDHPTVTALARHLGEEMGVGAAVAPEAPAATVVRSDADDPIVITGMACRFPGEIRTPEALWELLAAGGDVVSGFPTDRGWDLEGLYDPDPDREGTVYTREGGFLHDAGWFDPEFFGISPREALAMDPQQRLLLETAWEALERAGIDPRGADGARTGVFVGAAYQGYGSGGGAPEGFEGHMVTGTATSVASGRIAYALGLEGPAVTLDTACSSSLVALHQATQALRDGDCDRALVGGVAVMVEPVGLLGFSRQRGLAVDGRCKAFAAAADGMGLAEGAGMVTVERLSTARAAGRPVLAVVRATAINQDGASNGLSAPSGVAQQKVIRAALSRAGLTGADVDVVEAHGTGTTLGDPIEAQALLATYGSVERAEPLWLGSVKSNIGHTQAAAGVAGLMKTVLAMRHGTLPATLHVDAPSPHVEWDTGAVSLLTEARPWERGDRPRRAAVSSFGVSGTNAHVILEEPGVSVGATLTSGERKAPSSIPWPVSARTDDALDDALAGLRALDADPAAVGAVLAHRAVFERRAVLDGATGEELARGAGDPARSTSPVFVFPGQGAQWAGMGADLLDGDGPLAEAFAARLRECSAAVVAAGGPDVEAALRERDDLADVGVVQPVSWAVMVALAALWDAAGVRPAAVIGHSQGEIAAAVVAGALSVADGARIVTVRARALRGVAGSGAMGSVGESADAVGARLEGDAAEASVAARNAPQATVVSGPVAAVEALLAAAEAEGVRTRLLPVDYASHSALMEPLRDEVVAAIGDVTTGTPTVPWFSTVTPRWVDEPLPAGYWMDNLRSTVRFADAVEALVAEGHDAFVDVSAHPVLATAVGETAEAAGVPVSATGTLRRDTEGPARVVTALAEAWVGGVGVDWTALLPGGPEHADAVPTYPFRRRHLWLELSAPVAAATPTAAGWTYRENWVPVTVAGRPRLSGTWALVGRPDLADVLAAAGATVRHGLEDTTDLAGVLVDPDDGPATQRVLAVRDVLDAVDAPVWVLTRGGVAAGATDTVDPDAAALWGLGRIAAQERPDRWGGLVDVPAEVDPTRLAAVLSGALDGEDQVAVRPAGVLARRLTRLTAPDATWTPQGTVLVTGGTGALGAHVARRLASGAASRLVLTSRRGLDAPGARELADELGADVRALDVADRDALAALLDEIDPDAIVHTAGVVDDALLGDLTAEQLDRVLAPKLDAARALDALTRDRDLDAFVLFSSLAGSLGGPGQGAYAAANAAVDAIARDRHRAGLPATAVGWGAWAGGGLAAGSEERMARDGVTPMEPEDALDVLASVVGGPAPVVLVADVDWSRHAEVLTGSRPLAALRGLPEAAAVAGAVPGAGAGASDAASPALDGVRPEDRPAAVLDLVRGLAAASLSLSGPDEVAPDRAFRDLGFDSLTAVDLRNRLIRAVDVRLPVTLVFDHPTAAELAEHLLERLGGATTPVVADAPVAVTAGDDIAIVAMSCRLPGGVTGPEDLWTLLEREGDAVVGFPTDRGWDVAGRYHPDPQHAGSFATTGGGFLDDPAGFDAAFFGISPREALTIDPQQRLLLEASWEAFERAGIAPGSVRGTRTGVFVGSNYHDYGSRLAAEPGVFEGQLATGSAGSVTSGRVAYTFGLQGPAVTVDTACSSSLVAMHWAASALRSGECSMALAGGVTVISSLDTFVEFSRQGALSPDGRCRAFSEDADGAGWAEGVGLVLLERLSDARAAGHPVLGVLRGSAVNQDGASNGLTAPNGPAQQRVIRDALAAGGVSAADVDAVEAHGTGTSLGDPIEAQALLATYGSAERAAPLWLGSVKSNLGHTQAAAGVAGVIKAVLALQHGVFPASLHAQTPSSRIEWDTGEVAVASSAVDLPAGLERPHRIGVSSFGISGTNAHVIIEGVSGGASLASDVRIATSSDRDTPWLVSARSRAGVDAAVERLTAWAASHDADPAMVASALAGRTWFDERAVLLGESRVDGSVRSGPTVVVLPGQGAQRLGMGRELRETFDAYATAVDAAVDAVNAHLPGDLREVLWGEDAEQLSRTEWAQPALFVTQVAGFRLLESWGLDAPVLIGHSVGEIAAAHLSGALSLEDAGRLVVARGRLMGALPEGGSMAAVSGAPDVLGAIDLPASVGVAAHNAASSVVLSGETEALERVLGSLEDVRVQRLHTSHAFHSPLMAPAADDLAAVAATLTWSSPQLTVVSTVTGATDPDWADPQHWATQLTAPVLFAEAIETADPGRVVEVGPHPSLVAHVADAPTTCLGEKTTDPALAAHRAAAALWTTGADLDAWVPTAGTPLEDLPTYPFEHQRFWLDAPVPTTPASLGLGATGHPLLGGHLVLAGGEEHVLTGRLGTRSHPWLADHALGDTAILPATAYVELAQDAARRAVGDGAGLADLTIQAPLVLPANGDGVEVQVRVGTPDQDGLRTVTVDARADVAAGWTRHADGAIGPVAAAGADLTAWPPAGAEPLDVADLYDRTAAAGFAYGPAFRALRAAWRATGGTVLAEIALDEAAAADAGSCVIHPALLDAALHTVALDADPDDGAVMPFAVRDVAVSTPGARALRVARHRADDGTVALDLADGDGRPLGRLGAATLRPVPTGELRAAGPRPLYRTELVALDAPEPATAEVRRVAATPDALAGLDTLGDTVVLVEAPVPADGDPADRIREATVATLELVQAWLARPDDAVGARLAVVTRGPAPAAAAATGLLRSAQAENPDRVVVLDVPGDADPGDTAVLAAVASGEPEVAIEDGALAVRRLHRADAADARDPQWRGTVVVTGGTGALGAAVARHVVSAHGVARVVLVSRRGPDAEGADALRTDLTERGAEVEIVAADLATDDGVATVLGVAGGIGTVVHTAGIVDDGPVETLTGDRVGPVLAPKVDAALRLLDAAPDARLVLFSSLAGTFGGVGQGNYAAANAALDALARRARADGRDVTSIVWGLWAVPSGLTGGLTDVDRRRLERGGLAPMETPEALELLDVALGLDDAVTVAARLDVAALRLATGSVPPLLADLAPASTPAASPASPTSAPAPATGPDALAERLRGTSGDERAAILLDLVRGEAAGVLGHASPEAIPVDQGFLDLGFESLTAVELRNRLGAATGLRLPATVLFDHPDPHRLAGLLGELLPRSEDAAPADGGTPGLAEVDRLRHVVAGLNGDTATRETLAQRLAELLDELGVDPAQDTARRVEEASDDELFAMIDAEQDQTQD